MDYEALGFKSGLEIHQQLDSGKLFCNSPSLLRSEKGEFSVQRKLHAIAGEQGNVDAAVAHEASIDREFIYQGYDTISLVELDEEPPELIDEEALKIGLQIAMLLNCDIIPVSQVMRKTVIDGSNTSGFQRTVLIAKNGFIETSYGRVGIDSVVLEEDAARIISRDKDKTIYNLDRLGIPLIEIATSPDMKNPQQVKEAALILGDILRSCKVKRGIGTIRQDLNVSIKGHSRVEIKGFQDVKMFVPTLEKEVERQIKDKNGRSEVRKAEIDGSTSFLRPMPGADRMYPETDVPLLFISRDRLNEIKKELPKLRKDVKSELKKKGLSDELVNLIFSEDKVDEFLELAHLSNDVNLIAKVLVLWPKDISKKLKLGIEEVYEKLNIDVIEEVIKKAVKDKSSNSDIQDILTNIVKGVSLDRALSIEKIDSNEVEEFVIKLVKQKPGLSMGGYMGLVMNEFKGKISGKEVMDILKKHVK